MKLSKKKGYEGSIRKVWSDDKEVCFGVVGIVGDFLKEKILDSCTAPPDKWMFIPAPGIMQKSHFGDTRDFALMHLPRM